MIIQQRLQQVAATIDQLAQVVPAKELSYMPASLQDLTIEEFKEVLSLDATFDPQTSYDSYYAYGRIGGALVRATTASGTRNNNRNAKAELFNL